MKICGTCRSYRRGTIGRGRCEKTGHDQMYHDDACGEHVGRPRRKKKSVMVATLTGELLPERELRRRAVRPMEPKKGQG